MTTPQPSARLEALLRLLESRPDDPRAHFGLALEYESTGQWSEAAAHLERYLELARDEGNAYGRLGNALRRLGRDEEARAAYAQGIEAAYRHGHPSMAQEFEETLEEWDD
jgi:E3 SUMO-protein ligase RanBP2